MPINVRNPMVARMNTPFLSIKPGEYPGNLAAVLYPRDAQAENLVGVMKFLFQVVTPHGVGYITTPPFVLSLDSRGFFFNLMRSLAIANSSDELVSWLDDNGYVDEHGVFNEQSLIGLPAYVTVAVATALPNARRRYRSQQVMSLKSAPASFKLDPQWLIPGSFGDPKYDIVYDEHLEMGEPVALDVQDCQNVGKY